MRSVALAAVLLPGLVLADAKARPPESIQRVVGARRDALRLCYDQNSARVPAGTYKYTIAIAVDGRVKTASAKAPTAASAKLDGCVIAQLSKLMFEAGPETTVVYPFTFEAGAAPEAPTDTKPAAPAAQVDPRLVKMFDDAVAKAKAGKHAQALAGYRAVLETQRKQKLAVIPRFPATVHLEASYALMDLGKLPEAEKELALVDVDALGKATQYDFYFTKGNVLGGMGKVKPMFSVFVEAISISEDLDDMTVRPAQCWTKILAFTMQAKDWAYLKEVSEKAIQVARLRGFGDVETKARVALAEANQHLAKTTR